MTGIEIRIALVAGPAGAFVTVDHRPSPRRPDLRHDGTIPGRHRIASVETGDSGGDQVVIANSFGSVTSRVAQLTVSFLGLDCYAGIKVLGVPGRTYRIEATPAAGAADWLTLTNRVLPSSPSIWIDYESPTLPARLYRAAESP
jgi:hypothetical protein